MKEEFKSISGYEGLYEVSNTGKVKSLDRKVKVQNGYRVSKGKVISPSSGQYKTVSLWKDNKVIYRTIHSLVVEHFLGIKPNGHKLVVDHIDGNPKNNNANNLQVITNRRNTAKGIVEKRNKTSKYVGVSWSKSRNKWVAAIHIKGDDIYLGGFEEEEVASTQYLKAEKYTYIYKGVPKLFREQLNQVKL